MPCLHFSFEGETRKIKSQYAGGGAGTGAFAKEVIDIYVEKLQ